MELGPLQGAVFVRATTAAAIRFDKEAVPTFFKHVEEEVHPSPRKRRRSCGESDELGCHAATFICTPPAFHAVEIQLLGVDHKSLAWDRDGIERRITNLHGRMACWVDHCLQERSESEWDHGDRD
jgi:hypothetical protein